MNALSAELHRTVDAAEPILRKVSDRQSAEAILPGGWSRKQVLGHLIDSASNNHQRFVRAALQGSLEFPGYDQEGCVRIQMIEAADWSTLITLWASYNHYLAHVIAHLPDSNRGATCRIGSNQPVTLEFLAQDYLRHLLHHLAQIGAAPR